MASILFRMGLAPSDLSSRADFAAVTQSDPIHAAPHRSPKHAALTAAIFGIFSSALEPVEAKSVSYRGTVPQDKMPASIRFPLDPLGISESF
jgi:hypothetical protein